MFTPIEVKMNDRENISLFDTHDITIHRDGENNAELVVHPCRIGKLSIRFAKEPYMCRIKVCYPSIPSGSHTEWVDIDLGCEEDWGNVDTTDHSRPKFGNDADGYGTIEKVELNDGYPNGTEIPIADFCRDVEDFIVYYEC